MKLRFEKASPALRDCVLVEHDGTIFTSFKRTGYIKAIARTKFATGESASTGAFTVTSADAGKSDEGGLHALTFVSEVAGTEKIAIIERFQTAEDAEAAWERVQRALRRFVVRNRINAAWRGFLCYVGAPLIVFTVGMAAVRFMDSHNGSLQTIDALMRMAESVDTSGANGAAKPAGRKLDALPANAPGMSARDSGMVGGSQMAGIHFGLDNQAPEKTLYVFSDPNCPACQQFEPHIDALAKDYSVYVLPVAYQGGDHGKAASIAMCAADQKAAWQVALDGGGASPGSDCLPGYDAVKANMEQFQRLGFNSTPRVVNGSGYIFSEGATASMIRTQSAAR
ncbi:thioredoxin fold domain-containing protein [Burkholderia ubonensis]|uniref:Thioredoxin-like fold domain-containing protein n=1 Tax=Burkholderia ubonensis subsp. mesacidophila TaxID=265293 RepID=A0A2A4FBH6_9BURK|nr:thioredoxin fold domain-containing protein [Burkholderia ubonensis]PCE30032.1 hypothetical protein BZL54_22985 [Burkholderia ubonensis subsp. mesacidophila]